MGIVKTPKFNNSPYVRREWDIWDHRWDDVPSVRRHRKEILEQERQKRIQERRQKIERIQEDEKVPYWMAVLYCDWKETTDKFLCARQKRKQHKISQKGGDIEIGPNVDINWKELYEILGEEIFDLNIISIRDIYRTINTVVGKIQRLADEQQTIEFEVNFYTGITEVHHYAYQWIEFYKSDISIMIDILSRYLLTELPIDSTISFEPYAKTERRYEIRSYCIGGGGNGGGDGGQTFYEYDYEVEAYFKVKFS